MADEDMKEIKDIKEKPAEEEVASPAKEGPVVEEKEGGPEIPRSFPFSRCATSSYFRT